MRSFLSIRLTVMTFWLMAVLSLGSALPARAQFLPTTLKRLFNEVVEV